MFGELEMKTIEIHHPYRKEDIPNDDVVLVLGYFDGVHRGHQKVIAEGKRIAEERGLKLALMTFNQHPSVVFDRLNEEARKPLVSARHKEQLMEKLGVDIYYVIDFTSSFARQFPQEFVDNYLVNLHAKVVVSGPDYTYGKKDIADVSHLPLYADKRFEIVTVPEFDDETGKVSSTRIRRALDSGNIPEANQLLGYRYETTGIVVHGKARGRTLGYPTANIAMSENIRIPAIGVYVTRVFVNDKWYMGMTSVGYNETFDDVEELMVEVNILDFDEDIYGEELTIQWLKRTRGMVKFNSINELIDQLRQDAEDVRNFDFTSDGLSEK
jgi:riboflavin kinase/FMN adenylyltransferase